MSENPVSAGGVGKAPDSKNGDSRFESWVPRSLLARLVP